MTIFLHILALLVLDILLMAVLSWVTIAIMERERCVSKERKKDKDSNYFFTELKKERFLKDSKIQYEGIICRVTATHAISGVTYVREHDFKKKEVDEFFNRS